MTTLWDQYIPYNAFVPRVNGNVLPCGCVATAAAQVFAYHRWPRRFGSNVEGLARYVSGNGTREFPLRFDGRTPFDWENCANSYSNEPIDSFAAASTVGGFAAAKVILLADTLSDMSFDNFNGNAAFDRIPGRCSAWYELGENTPATDPNFTAKVEADLDAGCPVNLTLYGHQVVIHGYKIENKEHFYYVNRGYSGEYDGWYRFSGDRLGDWQVNYAWTGFRPRKKVQLEPIPRISTTSVGLEWSIAHCHAAALSGFTAKVYSSGSEIIKEWSDGAKYTPADAVATTYPIGGVFGLGDAAAISYSVVSRCVTSLALKLEMRLDGGDWQAIHVPTLASQNDHAKGVGYLTFNDTPRVDLSSYAGRSAEFRLALYATGGTMNDNYLLEINDVTLEQVTSSVVEREVQVAASARTLTLNGLSEGRNYSFTVTPIFAGVAGDESEPESTKVDSANAGPLPTITLTDDIRLKNGFHRSMSLDSRSAVRFTCSSAVTGVTAQVSHIARLPDNRVSVRHLKDGSWAAIVAPDPDAGEKIALYDSMIMTLTATDNRGSTASRDVVLCFNNANDDESAIYAFEDWDENSAEPPSPPPTPPTPPVETAPSLRLIIR